jgi:hypothetical protein
VAGMQTQIQLTPGHCWNLPGLRMSGLKSLPHPWLKHSACPGVEGMPNVALVAAVVRNEVWMGGPGLFSGAWKQSICLC